MSQQPMNTRARGVYLDGQGTLSLKRHRILQKWSYLCVGPNRLIFIRIGHKCYVLHPDRGLQPTKVEYTEAGYPYVDFCKQKLYLHCASWMYMNEGRFPFNGTASFPEKKEIKKSDLISFRGPYTVNFFI